MMDLNTIQQRLTPWLATYTEHDKGKLTALRIYWDMPPWDAYLEATATNPEDTEVHEALATWPIPFDWQQDKTVKTSLSDLVEPPETIEDTCRRLRRDMYWDKTWYVAYHRDDPKLPPVA